MLPMVLPALLAFAPADDGTFAFTQARVQAMNARNLDALVDLYEPGAESVQADGRSSKGSEALRALWQTRLPEAAKVEVKDATYVTSPDEVFVYGLVATSNGGASVVERFSELRVRRHGRWFVRFDSRQRVAP